MKISVIIPTYNEEHFIEQTLKVIQQDDIEIIVADGGSTDRTKKCAAPHATVIEAPRGRAQQMNAGAQRGSGDVLLFLHADTVLQAGWYYEVQHALKNADIIGGAYHIQFDMQTLPYRLMSAYANLRAKYTRMYHGDQAIFIRKDIFHRIGGYPDIPLMEDVILSRRMRHIGKTIFLKTIATTSARRIEKVGILKSILRYVYFKTIFFFGASPTYLATIYRKSD